MLTNRTFAKSAPEEVRAMFIDLFDENKDVYERIDAFKLGSSKLLERYGNGAAQHYQLENAISTYLWLRYPDRYYIYKFSEVKVVAAELEADYRFKKGAYADNVRNFIKLYDEICSVLQADQELINLLRAQLTDTCYPDPELRTLTIDVGFYISRYYSQRDAEQTAPEEWVGADYNPNLSVEDWKGLLQDETVFTPSALQIMKRMKDYEDFVMGYKPAEDGFELKYGIFYRFCQKAANQPDKEFFFIIDEINRGNMSKIFGELLMLIEKDYRGTKATLAYNGLPFSVPKNLYIIGMMNTADRSLAMIDYALRRRFSFYDMEPGFDSDGFIQYQNGLNNETLNELVERVKELNKEIAMDKSLGKGFCIGHSYFCGRDVCTDEWLHAIVNYDILPMLSEYWFDDAGKLQRWENILRGVFQ